MKATNVHAAGLDSRTITEAKTPLSSTQDADAQAANSNTMLSPNFARVLYVLFGGVLSTTSVFIFYDRGRSATYARATHAQANSAAQRRQTRDLEKAHKAQVQHY